MDVCRSADNSHDLLAKQRCNLVKNEPKGYREEKENGRPSHGGPHYTRMQVIDKSQLQKNGAAIISSSSRASDQLPR